MLLDSGAQVSLIRLSVAEELRLKGKDVTIVIAKVGGEEEEMTTKIFRVRIRSLENQGIHTVMAVGIPCISSDITKIRLNHVARLFGLREEKIRRRNGPVDLLVGIDHPKLHIGETKEAANLVARHSPLGWVVFGAMPGKHAQVNEAFNIKIATPIYMTDFWTTETMGVSAKLCECEIDKLSPIERREAKLSKNPAKRSETNGSYHTPGKEILDQYLTTKDKPKGNWKQSSVDLRKTR